MAGWGIPRGWPIDTSAPGGESYFEQITLAAGDITNKYITLAQPPLSVSEVALDIIGGCRQNLGTDYIMTISPNRISWNGLALQADLAAGDILSIIYSI